MSKFFTSKTQIFFYGFEPFTSMLTNIWDTKLNISHKINMYITDHVHTKVSQVSFFYNSGNYFYKGQGAGTTLNIIRRQVARFVVLLHFKEPEFVPLI